MTSWVTLYFVPWAALLLFCSGVLYLFTTVVWTRWNDYRRSKARRLLRYSNVRNIYDGDDLYDGPNVAARWARVKHGRRT